MLPGVAHEPLVGLDRDRPVGAVLAAEQRRRDALAVAAVAQLAEELVDEVAAVGQDQHAAGARGLDEAERGDRLAGAGRVLEPEALGGVGVLGLLAELLLVLRALGAPPPRPSRRAAPPPRRGRAPPRARRRRPRPRRPRRPRSAGARAKSSSSSSSSSSAGSSSSASSSSSGSASSGGSSSRRVVGPRPRLAEDRGAGEHVDAPLRRRR